MNLLRSFLSSAPAPPAQPRREVSIMDLRSPRAPPATSTAPSTAPPGAPSSTSPSASLVEKGRIPITEDVLTYVEELCTKHPQTLLEFPIDVSDCRRFTLGEIERYHASLISRAVPELPRLLAQAQPARTEHEFWFAYFTLLRQMVSRSCASDSGPPVPDRQDQGVLAPVVAVAPVVTETTTGEVRTEESEERAEAVREILKTKEMASAEFKREIRRGMVSEARAKLWNFVTGCSLYLMNDPSHFEDSLAACGFQQFDYALKEVPEFLSPRKSLHEVAQDNGLSNEQEDALLVVLRVLAWDEERAAMAEGAPLRFLPFLPDLSAVLVKVVGSHRAFTIASLLVIQSAIHGRFFPTTFETHHADIAELAKVVPLYAPRVARRMAKLGVDVTQFAPEWFDRLFVGVLPYPVVLRVLDCFFGEGRPVLWRVALALLQLGERSLCRATTRAEFLKTLREEAAKREDASSLIGVAFQTPLDDSLAFLPCTAPSGASYQDPSAADPSAASGVVAYNPEASHSKTPILESGFDDAMELLPLPDNPSAILTQKQYGMLFTWLPPRLRVAGEPQVVFTTSRDGFSLKQLLRCCENRDQLVLVVQSQEKNVFGAFIPVALRVSGGRYYGTGEAFLYTFAPEPASYEWRSGQSNYFFFVDSRCMSVGGGNTEASKAQAVAGLWIDDELLHGFTQECDTFRNAPLNDGKPEFTVVALEVFAFR